MSDLVLSVKLTGDGKGLVEVVGEGADVLTKFDKKADKVGNTTQRVARQQDRLGDSTQRVNKRYRNLGATLLTTVAAYASLSVGRELLNDFEQQEQAVAALDQSLLSMERTTEGLSQQLQTLASQIQNEGIIGDEAIIRGQSFLSTYKDITDDLLPRTTRLMADLAAKMGGDIVSAANTLGKASMGMVGELSRIGISLSDAAKESKDFEIILGEIEDQMGGMNAALAATGTGGVKQFSNAWGDVREQLGEVLTIGMSDYLRDMSGEMAISEERVLSMGNTLSEALDMAKVVVLAVSTAIASYYVISLAASALANIRATQATVTHTAVLLGHKRMTMAQAAANLVLASTSRVASVAMAFLAGPAGIAIAAGLAIGSYMLMTRDAADETDRLAQSTNDLSGAMAPVAKMGITKQIDEVKAKIAETNVVIMNFESNIQNLRSRSDAGAATGIAFNKNRIEQEKEGLLQLNQQLVDLEVTKKSIANINTDGGEKSKDNSLEELLANLESQRQALKLNKSDLIVYQAAMAVAKAENKSFASEVLNSARALANAQAANDDDEAEKQRVAKTQKSYESLSQSLLDEEIALGESFKRKEAIIDQWEMDGEGREQEAKARMLQLEQQYQDDKLRIQQAGMSAEQRVWESGWQGKLNITGRVMGSIANLLMSGNKKQFEQGKKLARASIALSTASAIMKAKDNPWPLNVLLVAEAAALGGLQLANVNSTSYGGGGSVSASAGTEGAMGASNQPAYFNQNIGQSQQNVEQRPAQQVNIHIYGNVVDLSELSRSLRPYDIELQRDVV